MQNKICRDKILVIWTQRRYEILESQKVVDTHIPYCLEVKVQLRVTCQTNTRLFLAAKSLICALFDLD